MFFFFTKAPKIISDIEHRIVQRYLHFWSSFRKCVQIHWERIQTTRGPRLPACKTKRRQWTQLKEMAQAFFSLLWMFTRRNSLCPHNLMNEYLSSLFKFPLSGNDLVNRFVIVVDSLLKNVFENLNISYSYIIGTS